MALNYFGYIISILIMISDLVEPDHVSCHVDTEFESQKAVCNIRCNYQNCTELCENDILENITTEVKKQKCSNVQININTTSMHLNSNVSFSNLTSLTINGEIINSTTLFCNSSINSNAGIVLSDVRSIALSNLRIIGCGSLVQRSFKTKNNNFSSALTIIRCRDVQINRVAIAKSNGTGLMILNHQEGTVSIKSSTFKENTLPLNYVGNSISLIFGGGGVYIHLGQFQGSSYNPMTFQFDNCTFENNTARNKHFSYLHTHIANESQESSGEGGGVYLSVGHTSSNSNVNVSFLNCTFADNYAFVGGGLSVRVYGKTESDDKTVNVSVNIDDSQFRHNGCRKSHSEYAHFGGGAYLSLQEVSAIENCHIRLTRVEFVENCAQYGGGVYYYSDRSEHSLVSDSTKNSAVFDECCFHNNTAHIGSAVDMTPNIFQKLSSGYSIVPTFKNCEFLANNVFINHKKFNNSDPYNCTLYTTNTPGLGTVRTSHQNIHFQGHNSFEGNWGTALYVVNAIVNFENSSASFVNNTGLQGGAIALVESASMIVGPQNYDFHNNSAYYQGGAIYVLLIDHFDIEISKSCFIQYADTACNKTEKDDVDSSNIVCNNWKASINFTKNHVLRGKAGHTIYATSLYPCTVFNIGTKYQPEYITVDPWKALTIYGIEIDCNSSHMPQIATDGNEFCVYSDIPLMVIPGKEYSHGITVIDDLGQNAVVPFRVVTHDSNMRRQLSKDVNPDATFVEDEIQLMGSPSQTAILNLHTLSARQIYIEVNVTLVKCPPGFVIDESNPNESKCICNEKAPVGIFKCNLEKFHSYLLPGYWVGVLEDVNVSTESSRLVTCTCPFCDYDKNMSASEFEVVLPQNEFELTKTVCGKTRTGTVCGSCQDTFTVHYHSPDFLCKPKKPVGCKLGWLFYILSELVPVTIIFIIVLVFNISFTSGTISGFILFSQLLVTLDIDASGIIKFSYSEKHKLNEWAQGYQMLYGLFNLEFFNSNSLSFCIMTNASALDTIAFKYITILYTLLLILSVIWIMNKCGGRCCGKYCRITTVRSSVIHGISSFLVICYTQCVQVSMNLLNPVHFNVELDSGFNPRPRVWLNGDIKYFSTRHLNYALPALFCLLTIGILPPALLLCYPLLNKVLAFFGCDDVKSNCLFCHKISVSYLKPLLDSFQSCFKDNMRFFAGLYFIYRWIILLAYAATQSYSIYYTTMIGGFLAILVLHTVFQPYVKRAHNIIDTLLLADLIIISCLSFYNYHKNHYLRGVRHTTTTSAAILQLVLIYLPLIVLGVYILMVVCKKIKDRKSITFFASDKLVPKRANKLREFIRTISSKNEDNDSDNVELTHDQLMDEDVDFDENACDYFKATDMILHNI